MNIDFPSFLFGVSMISSGIIYGHFLYRKGLKEGEYRTLDSLQLAGIIKIDEDGKVFSTKK